MVLWEMYIFLIHKTSHLGKYISEQTTNYQYLLVVFLCGKLKFIFH